ncbi:31667_t:CDS:2, partial [Racocetra persica]
MKFISAITTLITLFSTISIVSAHTSMLYPPVRGHPKNPNAAVKDFDCIIAPLNGDGGCKPKPFPCGGYPVDSQIVTTFKAGQVIDVKFFNPNFPDIKTADPSRDQARHNGGLCEFALSYDGGKTYTVIATYHKTCPDIFFENWKVKIPENAPSCDNPGKCIFSWSWINAVGNREFYQNCADIKLIGNSTEALPIIDITRANLLPVFTNIITPEGDPLNSGNAKGSGPLPEDVKANLALKIGPDSKKNNPNDGANKPSESNATCPDSDNGKMTCVNAGASSDFATCSNGKQVIRQCPGVL